MRIVREAQAVITSLNEVNICNAGGSCIINAVAGCGGK